MGCLSYAPLPFEPTGGFGEHPSDLEFGSPPQPLSVEAVSLLAVANNPDLKAARAEL